MILTIYPSIIPSTGWATNSDDSDYEENDSGNAWLKLLVGGGIPITWDIVGMVVRFSAGTSLTPGVVNQAPTLGQCGFGYQLPLSSLTTVTNAIYDGNTATYFGDSAPQSTTNGVTVCYDLGQPFSVTGFDTIFLAAGGASLGYIVDYSNDGVTWASAKSGSLSGSGAPGEAVFAVFGSPVTARWWRFSMQTTSSAPWEIQIEEFQIYTGSTGPDPFGGPLINTNGSLVGGVTIYPAHLEMGFATDSGSIPVTLTTPDLTGAAQSLSLGSPTAQWDYTLTPAILNQTGFGLFVRRPVGGSEDTSLSRLIGSVAIDIYYNGSGGSFLSTRASVHQSCYYGKEAQGARGTAVATPNRFKSVHVQTMPNLVFKPRKNYGSKLPAGSSLITEHTDIPVEGYPTYDEMGVLLSSIVSQSLDQLIAGSETAYRHTFQLNNLVDDTISTYSLVYGDAVRAQSTTFAQLMEFALKFTRHEATLSASGFAQPIVDSASLPVGANEVQTLTFIGPPTGGTFRLKYKQQETSDIAWNATAATLLSNISTALNALATLASAGVVVSGSGPFTVTYSGANTAGINQPLLELSKNNMTGGGAGITIAVTTQGGCNEMACVPILPGEGQFYIASTYAGIAAGLCHNVFTTDLKLGGKAKPYWPFFSGTLSSFGGSVEGDATLDVTVVAEADSEAMPVLADARAGGVVKYLRLIFTSAQLIDGTNPYRLQIDIASEVQSWTPYSDQEGVYATGYVLGAKFDSVAGYSAIITLDNNIASY